MLSSSDIAELLFMGAPEAEWHPETIEENAPGERSEELQMTRWKAFNYFNVRVTNVIQ